MLLVQGNFKRTKTFFENKIKKKYFEFSFGFVSEEERFREIDRFLWESKKEMTVFKNRYIGPCVIDISEWNDRICNRYFEAFMYFILDLSSSCDIYLTLDKECSNQLKSNLELFFSAIKIVSLGLDKSQQQTNVKIPLGFHFSQNIKKDEDYVRNKI